MALSPRHSKHSHVVPIEWNPPSLTSENVIESERDNQQFQNEEPSREKPRNAESTSARQGFIYLALNFVAAIR